MRKINLDPYLVECVDEKGAVTKAPYNVRLSLVNSLFHPDQKLGAMELLNNDRLAQKIKLVEGSDILLEEEEYSRVQRAIQSIHGYTQNDVELVRRIMEAPEVPVKEA